MRSIILPHLSVEIGNGLQYSALYSSWLPCGTLAPHITPRMMSDLGLNVRASIAELIQKMGAEWPDDWKVAWPILQHTMIPVIHGHSIDRLMWVNGSGNMVDFSVHEVYETIRPRCETQRWASIVWTRPRIPKHSFVLWCAILNRLPTQDRVQLWYNGELDIDGLVCPLCKQCLDSISHLFFLCPYSTDVWKQVMIFGAFAMPITWNEVIHELQEVGSNQLAIRTKLLFASTVYHVWTERNRRLFQNISCDAASIAKRIAREMRFFIEAKKCRFQIHDGEYVHAG